MGGPWGYGLFLTAISDPDHTDHEEFLDWVGGEFDPAELDVDEVNEVFVLTAWTPLRSSAGPG